MSAAWVEGQPLADEALLWARCFADGFREELISRDFCPDGLASVMAEGLGQKATAQFVDEVEDYPSLAR